MSANVTEAKRRKPRVAKTFTTEHFRAWSSQLELDNGEQFEVEQYQAAFARDVFKGFTVNWLVVPEGNGKTTFLAALALYVCEHRPFSVIPVAASSREQAEILYRQAEGFVVRTPELYQRVDSELARRKGKRTEDVPRFDCLEGYRRVNHVNGSRMQVFAADDRTGDGVIPTLAILEELHRHRSLRLYRTWLGKMAKRGGQAVVLSTAGEPGGEFEDLREQMRRAGEVSRRGSFVRAATSQGVIHDWALPETADPEDFSAVAAANPASWVGVRALRAKYELPGMTLAHWRRFTCNQPTREESSAISEADWHAARVDDEIPTGAPIMLGLDLGWRLDTTAVVPLWVRDNEYRLLGAPAILEPPANGNMLDPHLVENAIRGFCETYTVEGVVMDMTRGAQLAAWMEEELGVTVFERSQQQSAQVQDYEAFTEALRLGWLRHIGDAGLTRHVLNSVARVLPGGQTRFERPAASRNAPQQQQRVIDALVAAAMVHAVAAQAPAAEEFMVAWG